MQREKGGGGLWCHGNPFRRRMWVWQERKKVDYELPANKKHSNEIQPAAVFDTVPSEPTEHAMV